MTCFLDVADPLYRHCVNAIVGYDVVVMSNEYMFSILFTHDFDPPAT